MSSLGHEGIIYGTQQNRMYVICDFCGHFSLNSNLGVNGMMGLRSWEGGVYGFCGICGSVSGVGKFKNEDTNRTR